MDKEEAYEIGLTALRALVEQEGVQARFPFDAVWNYAQKAVPSLSKPGVANRLKREGYIKPTGASVRAVTGPRAGSPTTEYAVGPKLARGTMPAAGPVTAKAANVATALEELHAALNAEGYVFSIA